MSLDPIVQISLFGKLKLVNCADFTRVGSHAGFCFGLLLMRLARFAAARRM
jgi:hypothetical protein